jgi:hypothetical protein
MTALRTALQNEINHNVEYGEAILTALHLKAQRQIEMVAPHQPEGVIGLYRLMLDIQAVQDKLGRERYRLSICR